MAAATKEISMDAEAATVLSKPGGVCVWNQGKQSVLAEVIFSVEKHLLQVRQDFPEPLQRISPPPTYRQLSLPGLKKEQHLSSLDFNPLSTPRLRFLLFSK